MMSDLSSSGSSSESSSGPSSGPSSGLFYHAFESDSDSESDSSSNSSCSGSGLCSGFIERLTYVQRCIYFSMINLKPAGINKHLSMMLLQKNIKEQFNIYVSSKYIWSFLDKSWDKKQRDKVEGIRFDNDPEEFDLPEEYAQLIEKEKEKLEEFNIYSDETNSVSNLITPVHSNDNLNEIISFPQNTPAQTSNENSPEEIQSRSFQGHIQEENMLEEFNIHSNETNSTSLVQMSNQNSHEEIQSRRRSLRVSNTRKMQVEIEENNKGVKPRRLTSDLFVCEQKNKIIPSMTRRSCCKKT